MTPQDLQGCSMEAAAAIIAGNRLIARLNVEGAIESSGNDVDTWLLYAWTSDSPAAAQLAISRALEIDPENELAQAGQRWVQGIESKVTELVSDNDQGYSESLQESTDAQDDLADTVESEIESLIENKVGEATHSDPLAVLASVFDQEPEPCDTGASDQVVEPVGEVPVESEEDLAACLSEEDAACNALDSFDDSEPVLESAVEEPVRLEAVDQDVDQLQDVVSVEAAEEDLRDDADSETVSSDTSAGESERSTVEGTCEPTVSEEGVAEAPATDDSLAEPGLVVENLHEIAAEAVASDFEKTGEASRDETVESAEPVASVITNEALEQVFESNETDASTHVLAEISESEQLCESPAVDEAPQEDGASVDIDPEVTASVVEPASASLSDSAKEASLVDESQTEERHEDSAASTDALGALQETIEDLAAAIQVPQAEAPVVDQLAVSELEEVVQEQELLIAPTVPLPVVEEQIVEEVQEIAEEVSHATESVAPAAVETASTEDAEATAAPIETQPCVMIVDDSPTIRKLVSMTLSRNGFNVITANDGVEALKILAEQRPDIILSDINMPRLGGYQLCKFVKKHTRTKLIPVLLLSGKDGVFDKMRGKLAGCNGYITKPFESADLVHQVRSQLLSANAI